MERTRLHLCNARRSRGVTDYLFIYFLEPVFVVVSLRNRGQGATIAVRLRRRLEWRGVESRGSQHGEPRWPFRQVAVATVSPAVNEAGVSR